VRDSLALPFDFRVSPAWAFESAVVRASLTGLGLFNDRVNLLATTRMLDDMALDKYSFIRDAYLQRRRSMVFDGNEPEPAPEVLPVAPVSAPVPVPAPSLPAAAASGVSN
jgi:phospholipid-binding lipoprotein MlaA